MRSLPVAMVVCLLLALPPTVTRAQPPCSFVLGFAEFASRAGDLVGECVEEQRTLNEPERVMVLGYGSISLQTGTTVQATTHGLLRWNEELATVEFLGRDGFWRLGDNGLVLTRWETAAIPPGVSAAPVSSTIPEPLKPAWDALLGNNAMVAAGPQPMPIGTVMQQTVAVTDVTLQVAQLPSATAGQYRRSDNSLTINSTLIGEDPRALASVLSHELTHARQIYASAGSKPDCVRMEVDAYMTEASVWVNFWTDQQPPTRTSLERHLTGVLEIAASEGEPGMYKLVVTEPGSQEQCQLWVPEGAAPATQSPASGPAPSTSKLTPALAARCTNIATDVVLALGAYLGATPGDAGKLFTGVNAMCRHQAEQFGAPGVDCFEPAAREMARRGARGDSSVMLVRCQP